jgi:hypothetical protein
MCLRVDQKVLCTVRGTLCSDWTVCVDVRLSRLSTRLEIIAFWEEAIRKLFIHTAIAPGPRMLGPRGAPRIPGTFDGIGLWGYCQEGLDMTPFKEDGKEGGCVGVAASDPIPELHGKTVNAGAYGEWMWPLPRARKHPRTVGFSVADADAMDRLVMRDCIEACIDCSRCRVISVSRLEKDCSWYSQCDTSHLGDAFGTYHRSFVVRGEDGSVTADAARLTKQALEHAPVTRIVTPRVVDVVVYGGPHYDAVLELRMRELSETVGLFIVVQHARPRGPDEGRSFDPARAGSRFQPFAHKVSVYNSEQVVDEFLDLDVMNVRERNECFEAMRRAFATFGRSTDVVIAGDIDEVPRAGKLKALLNDSSTLAVLADSTMFALVGPTYYYHLECEASDGYYGRWTRGPRLMSADMFGPGTNCPWWRDHSKVGDGVGRCASVAVEHASWHLRYFMPAHQLRETLCRMAAPEGISDTIEWWNAGSHFLNTTGTNVAALCKSPSRIRHAVSECLDLWGRDSGRGYERVYRKNMSSTGGGLRLIELPALVAEQQEHFLFAKLSQVHELANDEGTRRYMRTRRRLRLRPGPW